MCKKIAYVLLLALLLSGCGPVLFTVGGHSVTVGGVILSQTVKQVIKEEDERTNNK